MVCVGSSRGAVVRGRRVSPKSNEAGHAVRLTCECYDITTPGPGNTQPRNTAQLTNEIEC